MLGFVALGVRSLRRTVLVRRYGLIGSHQLSTITLSALIFAAAYVFLRIGSFGAGTLELAALGSIWATLSFSSELLVSRYVLHHPWRRSLADYDLRHGRIWILVVIAALIAPLLAARLI